MKADISLSDRLMSLFTGNKRAHGTHGLPEWVDGKSKWGIRATAKTVKGPPTLALWEKHLRGEQPLGVIPIREDNSCCWGSIDFDEYDTDLFEIIERVKKAKLPLVPCRSKSGGLHLFLFLQAPEPAADVQSTLRAVATFLGLANIEIFPKQTELDVERRDSGNWIVMPYFGGTFGGKLKAQVGLKPNGAEMSPNEFLLVATELIATTSSIASSIKASGTTRTISVSRQNAPSSGDFTDGPPCLQALSASRVQSDGRKRTLFMMAIYFKRVDPTGWKDHLEDANRRYFSPPLPAEEVVSIIKSSAKKDYQYTCKEEPMRGCCDARICRTRRFGIGPEAGGDAPRIVSWRKVNSDAPVWFMTMEGSSTELEIRRVDDFMRYPRFCEQMAKQLDMFLPPLKQAAWIEILNEAKSRLVVETETIDVTREGRFRGLLETFLTDRSKGERRVDILSGRPWEDVNKKRHEFTMDMLHNFLMSNGMRDASLHECKQWVKQLGGGRVSMDATTLAGKGVRLWYVPSEAVQATPLLPTPSFREEEQEI